MLNGFPMSIIEIRFKGNPCLMKPMKGAKDGHFIFGVCVEKVCAVMGFYAVMCTCNLSSDY
jgi:hypothetical protein